MLVLATLKKTVDSGAGRKVRLRVPNRDLEFAYEEMRS